MKGISVKMKVDMTTNSGYRVRIRAAFTLARGPKSRHAKAYPRAMDAAPKRMMAYLAW